MGRGARSRPRLIVPRLHRLTPTAVRNRKSIISQYHTQLKLTDGVVSSCIECDTYQAASHAATRSARYGQFNTSHWIGPMIQQYAKSVQISTVHILDVGSLANYYQHLQHITVRAIDISPHHHTVEKMDFFDLPYRRAQYHCIVLSLVLNYVPDKSARGDMLLRCRHMLPVAGYLYIVLPVQCIDNSRYINHTVFEHILSRCALQIVHTRRSKKLILYVCVAVEWRAELHDCGYKPAVIRTGDGHNNFNVCLRGQRG